jgi:hypothetical protein
VKLIIPPDIEKQIGEVVYDSVFAEFKETGVTLFGQKEGENFLVKGIAGPGPDATHEPLHYSGNNDYSTMVFEDLLKGNPNLKYLGELHLHPFGMRRLSHGDLETVKEVLAQYPEFIAGVMLRSWRIKFYPVYFSKEKPDGERMEVETHCGNRFGFGRQCGR